MSESIVADRDFLDGVAERWLCWRYRWNGRMFRGEEGTHVGGLRFRPYRMSHSRHLTFRADPKFEVLRIDKWERFGNSALQIRNVIHVAESLGIRAIEFPGEHACFVGDRAGPIMLSWGAGQRTAGPAIEGRFFELNAFRLPLDPVNNPRVFADYVRPLVRPDLRVPDPRLRDDDMVAHFRAGDIFAGDNVHSEYGQPPLSYYLAAVEREQPKRVWLVFEDRSNPCVGAMETALRQRGVEVIMQSASLAEDLRVLLNARRIVSGRGSFVPAIAHLSTRLDRLYYFEKGNIRPLLQLGVEVIKGKDQDGDYKATVLSGQWKNSPEQHRLMLSYPADKLAFEPLRQAPMPARLGTGD